MKTWIHTLKAYRLKKNWGLFDFRAGKYVKFGGRVAMKSLEAGYWSE